VGFLAAQEGAQQAVHHRRQTGQTAPLGQLHRGADGGGGGHPVAVEQLVEAQVQQPAQLGGLAQGWHLAQFIQPGIQLAALADRSVGQFGGQGPVGRGQGVALELPFQGPIGIGPGGHRLQHLPGELAGLEADGGRRGGAQTEGLGSGLQR